MAAKTSARSQNPRGSKRKSTSPPPEPGKRPGASGGPPPFLGYHIGQPRDYSEATAARVDREVESLLAERQSVALRLLTSARKRLDALVETLLKEETLSEEQLLRVLGPRPSAEAPPKPERPPVARSSVR